MSNVLSNEQRQQILALGRLGWTLRRIAQATGSRRETVSAYLKAAGLAVRGPGRPATQAAKPAISGEVSTDSAAAHPATTGAVSTDAVPPGRAPTASACEPFRERIEAALTQGRNAVAIYQDLVSDHGFPASYASVRRFVRRLRGRRSVEARVVITTAPGEEGQVDYGSGPMVRDPHSGRYRRTRLFAFTLGYSRATQLAHADPVRLAHHGGHEVELHQSQPPCPKWPVLRCRLMAAFEVSTEAERDELGRCWVCCQRYLGPDRLMVMRARLIRSSHEVTSVR